MDKKTLFRCPVCFQQLARSEKSYYCPKGHSYDISRKGYVNLLLPGNKGSGDPGDSSEMVFGRREFLNKGFYGAFSDMLNEAAAGLLKGLERIAVLDAGCGEGYYTCRLKDKLSALHNPAPDIYAIDVSKPAVALASGRDRSISFAVASSYHLPLLDASMDCIVCIFSPRDEPEFKRVLKDSGFLIVAAPGPKHLFTLRKQLYKSAEPIGQKGTVGEGFELLEQRNAAYEIKLENEQDIINLVKMTPYSRHTDEAELDNIKGLEAFTTEVDINIMLYRKVKSNL